MAYGKKVVDTSKQLEGMLSLHAGQLSTDPASSGLLMKKIEKLVRISGDPELKVVLKEYKRSAVASLGV